MNPTRQQLEEHVRERLLDYAPDEMRAPLQKYLQNAESSAMSFIDPETLMFYEPEVLQQRLAALQNVSSNLNGTTNTPEYIKNSSPKPSAIALQQEIDRLTEQMSKIQQHILQLNQALRTEQAVQSDAEKEDEESQEKIAQETSQDMVETTEQLLSDTGVSDEHKSAQGEDQASSKEPVTEQDELTSSALPLQSGPNASSRPDPESAIHALRDAGYETEASQLEAASRDENFDTSWLFGNGTLSSPDRIRMLMQSETIGKQLESSRNKAQGAPDQPENKEGKDNQKPTVLNNLFNSFRRN